MKVRGGIGWILCYLPMVLIGQNESSFPLDSIKTELQSIYQMARPTDFDLTRDSLFPLASMGSEVVLYTDSLERGRYLISAMGLEGMMAAELYFGSGQLLHAFLVFEYFKQDEKKSTFKNFKGLPAYEYRWYYGSKGNPMEEEKGTRPISLGGIGVVQIFKRIQQKYNIP